MLNPSSLNPQQRQAVETIDGPVLILAGAGTGKTRVITCRVAWMIARGVAPANILAVTFTNKAAREMQERVRKLLPRTRTDRESKSGSPSDSPKLNADTQPTICTFHSLCVRILRQHIEKLGYKRNFVIYDESEQLSAVKKILARISARNEKTDPSAILAMLSRLKNACERLPRFSDEGVQAMAQHIRQSYESALRACNAVDFDDLILLTLRLFSEFPDALEACRAKYRYVMVDEYQDTNAAQFRLVQTLTQKHRNLCVVGDDDQSIYGWRGAEISNLLDMEKHFPEVKIVKLEQNYRSSNTILRAANAIITRNARRRGKNLWSQKGDGAKIMLHTFKDDDEEARTIVEQIEFTRRSRGVSWAENAILFRTNAQSRPLETALRLNNVRYHLIGGQSFFDRREIRDFLAYLKMFLNPNDDVSLLRIANVPARGLSESTMQRLLAASHERKCSVFAVMKNPAVAATFQAKAREGIEAFVELIEGTRGRLLQAESGRGRPLPSGESLSKLGDEDVPAPIAGFLHGWADHMLDEIGYFNELRRCEKTPEAAESRIRNLKDLMATLDGDSLGESPFDRLQTFLEELTLETDREEEQDAPDNAVTLITMHSCKGLEFPNVFVVGMEDGLLPHTRSREEGTLDEERRLFYVAITRAMHTLTISHCSTRKKFGTPVACQPSRFLSDLPAELVEHADEKGKQPVPPQKGKIMFDVLRQAAE
jgi:DNA helicase-2/ATP-dependent DNA helicase PcrA